MEINECNSVSKENKLIKSLSQDNQNSVGFSNQPFSLHLEVYEDDILSDSSSDCLQIVTSDHEHAEENTRTRKRRHSQLEESEAEAFSSLEAQIDRQLDAKAAKTNLSVTNVKNILKHVITNKHVIEMVRHTLKENEAADKDDSDDEDCPYEPKLTRAKTKELLKSQPTIAWPITPAKNYASECQVLIEQELPEDSSDEEYQPNEEEQSDDEKEACASDVDSQALTPLSVTQELECSQPHTTASNDTSTQTSWTEDGLFRIPQEHIGQRTRSKLSLSDTPLETIEQAFIPPDITTDMYDSECDDEDWKNFLKDFMKPLSAPELNEPVDDYDADPEYNILADEEDVDNEELQMDETVEVSRKELDDLVAELFEVSSDDEDQGEIEPLEAVFISEEQQEEEPGVQAYAVEMHASDCNEVLVPLSAEQTLLVGQQMRKHVQLTTQHFLQCYLHPLLSHWAPKCKEMLLCLKYLAGDRSKSAFIAENLTEAIKLIQEWEERWSTNTTEAEHFVRFMQKEVERGCSSSMAHARHMRKSGCFKQLFVLLAIATTLSVVFYNMISSVIFCSEPYKEPWLFDQPVPYYEASDPAKRPFLVWSPECKIPNLDPFHESLSRLMGPPQVANCSTRPPLTHVSLSNDSRLQFRLHMDVRPAVVALYAEGQVRCCYSAVSRPAPATAPGKRRARTADTRYTLSECTHFEEETLLPPETEFILVRCFTSVFSVFSKDVYINMHAMVPVKKSVSEKIKTNQEKNKGLKDTGSNSLSVLLLGIDGTSRLNLIRKMPSTFTYLKGSGWLELAGYNKVGLNTFPNIFPLLTGLRIDGAKNETCFPSNEKVLDNCPFLWKNYSDRGFVTAFGEDAPDISTFNFNKVGFLHQPTDYYLRTYMLVLYKKVVSRFSNSRTPCFDSMEITDHVLWYARDFATTFKNNLFFGMFWLNNFSHDDHNNLAAFDHQYHDFFVQLHEAGVMNKTMVIFFSDHGMRFGKMAQHPIGRFEDKLPFLYMWLPDWYRKQNKQAIRNLRTNGGRLTSSFDVYKTLKYNLLHSSGASDYDSWNKHFCKSSMNLFEEVPITRSCEDACIPPEWCTCVTYEDLPKDDATGVEATHYVVSKLQYVVNNTHKLLTHEKAVCAQLSLREIIKISKNAERKNAEVEEFVVQFMTIPGNAVFEAMVRHHHKKSTYELVGDINRISRYGNQSWCVDDSVMKNYCYCEMS